MSPVMSPAEAISFRPGELELTPDGGHLLVSRCSQCSAHYFPSREVCARCHSDQLETVPLSGPGELYTYTIVRQSTPDFPVPYVLGYVDFPAGVRVMGQVAGIDADQVTLGMTLMLSVEEWGTDDEGRTLMGYRFRPVEVDA